MSNKFKSTFRPGYMRNFSTYVIDRYILFEKTVRLSDEEKNMIVKTINERLWQVIQEMNILVEDRLIPFVILKRVIKQDESKLRVVFNPLNTEEDIEFSGESSEIILKNQSHLMVVKNHECQRVIQLGKNVKDDAFAEVLANSKEQIAIIVDMLLDIAMFNSFSYLKKLPNEERRKFNALKVKFYDEQKLPCYMYINPDSPPTFLSFAFSKRFSVEDFDLQGYIDCWHIFIDKYFSEAKNINIDPSEQLKHHRDYDQIPNKYKSSKYWAKYPKGSYLLLRINKDIRDEIRRDRIKKYFKIGRYHVGAIRIVDSSAYYIPYIKQECLELNISAFKIVV